MVEEVMPPAAEIASAAVTSSSAQPPAMTLRVVAGSQRSLPFGVRDFEGGVLDYIATRGRSAPRQNPALAKWVRVIASSLAPDSAHESAVVGREAVRCVTMARANSFFVIDLVRWVVAPTHYSLRHYSSWDVEAVRRWSLEGSIDGATWTLLIRHDNDAALAKRGATHTWKLPRAASSAAYRFFRVLQWGLNSSAHAFLALSGFEVYGELSEIAATSSMVAPLGGIGEGCGAAAAASELEAGETGEGASSHLHGWDVKRKDFFLQPDDQSLVLSNLGSGDHWQSALSARAYHEGVCRCTLEIESSPPTANDWALIVGVAPADFHLTWVGDGASFGYIASNGAKVRSGGTTSVYGSTFGASGDRITIVMDFARGTLSFELNGVDQGVAFDELVGPLHVAVSMSAMGARVRLLEE